MSAAPQLHGTPPEGVRLLEIGEPNIEHVVAPAGDGVWRRMPWPVTDDLFELPPAADPRAAAEDIARSCA